MVLSDEADDGENDYQDRDDYDDDSAAAPRQVPDSQLVQVSHKHCMRQVQSSSMLWRSQECNGQLLFSQHVMKRRDV